MFFRRRSNQTRVAEGALFERPLRDNVTEVAEVAWIGQDPFGIPHVRFNMSYRRCNGPEPQGSRMLALETFLSAYKPIASHGI